MGLRETIAHDQMRRQLVSAPAADLLHGAVNVIEQDFRWVRPLRFADEQLRALGSCQAWHPGLFKLMARATSGITVEFETDAREVALEVRVDEEPRATQAVLQEAARAGKDGPQEYDGISVDVDKRHVWCGMPQSGDQLVVVQLDGEDPEDALGLQPLPGMARTRRVRIWLPALRGCLLREVLCDGTFVRPLAARKQLLVLGDSIVQGFVAGDPACTWPALLAAKLNLDLVNQGIAGQVFQPGSLRGLVGLVNPQRIVVAFGTNYRREACQTDRVSRDIKIYLAEVAQLWPEVKVHVLTPLWYDEARWSAHPRSCCEQIPSLLAQHIAKYDNMMLVNGLELMEHDASLLADGCVHPTEQGCRQVATRLNGAMRVPGLRPSSVGKRRKAKKGVKAKGKAHPVVREPRDNSLIQLPFTEKL